MRRGACSLVTAALVNAALGVSWSVRAEPTDDAVEKARASFQQGVQLFREGSLEAAVAEFTRAYRLSPSYRVLYNIGQVYYELHDYANALRAFKQYMDDGASDISEARRAEVEALYRKLEARIGQLDIRTNVEGAEILVDDVSVGVSPLPSPVAVNAGPRKILVSKAGYASVGRQVTVAGGETEALLLELAEPSNRPVEGVVQQGPGAKKASAGRQPRAALALTIVTAGICAAGTVAFGTLALGAKHDFEEQLNSYPASKTRIDSARATLLTYSVLTDAFAVATLATTGLAVYYLWSWRGKGQAQGRSGGKRSLALRPTYGGLLVSGGW